MEVGRGEVGAAEIDTGRPDIVLALFNSLLGADCRVTIDHLVSTRFA